MKKEEEEPRGSGETKKLRGHTDSSQLSITPEDLAKLKAQASQGRPQPNPVKPPPHW